MALGSMGPAREPRTVPSGPPIGTGIAGIGLLRATVIEVVDFVRERP